MKSRKMSHTTSRTFPPGRFPDISLGYPYVSLKNLLTIFLNLKYPDLVPNPRLLAALKFCFKTCVAMKFVDDDDDDDDDDD